MFKATTRTAGILGQNGVFVLPARLGPSRLEACATVCFAALILSLQSLWAMDTFNAPALKVNTRVVSIRQIEAIYSDSYALIQDKIRKGELNAALLSPAIQKAWTEALETATQDEIMDQLADKRRKDIMRMYIERAGAANVSGEHAVQRFKAEEARYTRMLRREMINAAGGEEELRQALRRRGQTLTEWENGLSRELFRRDVLSLELGPIVRSPAAARNFFEKNPDLFRQDEVWRLRRIRIAKSKFNSPEVALGAATLTREKILKGADFAEIASKVSDDPEYVQGGGLMTVNGRTDLPSGTFLIEERVAAALKDGEISEPFESGEYYLIVQRAGYRPLSTQKFEEAADRAEALAYSEKLRLRKRELFEKLKDQNYVEVLQKGPPANVLKGSGAEPGEFRAPK